MSEKVFNVLFLCTGNTARSILAEGILRSEGIGRFHAYSAGSQPKGAVNPFAVETLEAFGDAADGLNSKSWTEFVASDAPKMDFIITVCDDAAGEVCPVWPGHPATSHWGIADPAAVEGSDVEKRKAFNLAFKYLKNRIDLLLATPLSRLDKMVAEKRLAEIGRVEGATEMTATKV